MKNPISLSLVAALAIGTAACTGDFEEINSNPYQPGDLTADDYAIGSAMNNIAGTVMSPDVNTLQFTDCLLGGPLAGYFADSKAEWGETPTFGNPKDDWSRVFLKSDKVISTLYSNLNQVRIICNNSGDETPLVIAKVIKVACMHRVADTYGPIPYTKIGADGSLATPYDDQKTLYTAFITELDEAIEYLNEHLGEALNPNSDYVFSGNIAKWVKFANSLKLRLAMRIVNAEPAYAKQKAEEAVRAGVIESNDGNAAWNYFSTITNPLYTAVQYNADSRGTGGDTHAAADIICYMNGYSDPRRDAYFVKSKWDGIDFVGLRRGWLSFETSWGFNFSGVNVKPTDPLIWMNAAEVAFIRAEGAAIYGWDMGGTAESFYNQGITLSFEQWGVSGAEEYLADDSSIPEAYTDPSDNNQWNGALPTVTIKWDPSATPAQMQERIIVQKWIANWLNGCESWCDIRRTGYPKLIPVANNKGGGIVDSNLGPQRMPYPQEEYTNNSFNVTQAVNDYLFGPDNLGTKLWWAKK